jgi:hypothetical protein
MKPVDPPGSHPINAPITELIKGPMVFMTALSGDGWDAARANTRDFRIDRLLLPRLKRHAMADAVQRGHHVPPQRKQPPGQALAGVVAASEAVMSATVASATGRAFLNFVIIPSPV